MIKLHRFLLTVIIILGVVTPVSSQEDWNQRFESSWKYSCAQDDPGACQLFNSFKVNDTTVARVSVYPLDKNEDFEIVEVLYPLGVSLTKSAYLELDGREKYRLQQLTCKINGCLAFALKSTAFIQAMREGVEVRLYFTGYDDEKLHYYQFDLSGYAVAYSDYRTLVKTKRSCQSQKLLWPNCVDDDF